MKYVVIKLKNSQYRVSEDEEILIDRLLEGEKLTPEVLLYVDGENMKAGEPNLDKVAVKLEVLGEEMGKKIHVQKFRSKSRYRRKIGSRPKYTRIKVGKISVTK